MIKFTKPLVIDVLNNWTRYQWTLQSFGMLHTYITRELRMHVWNSAFTVPNVTTIHDHPWDFVSSVVVGRIVNTRYNVHPCTSLAYVPEFRQPYVKSMIVCGPGGGNDPASLKARGKRVWLSPCDPTTYEAGETYQQHAEEIHHTSYDDGTVTLVSRTFKADTEHANVFFKADDGWVSAEPRLATLEEAFAFVSRAKLRF